MSQFIKKKIFITSRLTSPVVTLSSITSSSINVGWTVPTNATNFILYRSTAADFSVNLITLYQGTNTSYSDNSGLSSSTTYYYKVLAKGVGYIDSFYGSNSATTSSGGTLLSTPTLERLGLGTTSVSFRWLKNNIADTFEFQRATDSGFTTGLTTLYNSASSGLIPAFSNSDYCILHDNATNGLVAGGTYYYRVRAKDSSHTFSDSLWGTKTVTLGAANKLCTLNGNYVQSSGVEGAGDYFSFYDGSQVLPVYAGDTIALGTPGSGNWLYFYLADFHGTPSQPLIIRNNGQIAIDGGFSFLSCSYINVDGHHSSKTEKYGFRIGVPGNGTCVSMEGLCRHMTIGGIITQDSAYSFRVKNEENTFASDPDCGAWTFWPHRMTDIEIYDIDASNHFQDTFYMGTSGPWGGRPFSCNGSTIDPRPTGFANMYMHDINIYGAGRQGIQVGNWDAGTNRITRVYVEETGFELNNGQGAGIATGSAVGAIEIDHCTFRRTWFEGFYSFNFGQLYFHDNTFDQIGLLTNPITKEIFHSRIDTVGGQSLDAAIVNGANVVPAGSEYRFQIYDLDGAVGGYIFYTQKLVPNPVVSVADTIAAAGTTPLGAHAGTPDDPFVGFGANSTILSSQVILPTDVKIPYGVSSFRIDPHTVDPVTVYGNPAGKTTFRIENNSFGTQTQPDTAVVVLAESTHNYNTPNIICGNTYLGANLLDANISKQGDRLVTYTLSNTC